jgi:hypothetical protein
MSSELLALVDAAAEKYRWARNAAVVNLLWDVLSEEALSGDRRVAFDDKGAKAGGGGDGARVSVLRKAKSKAEHVHPVQPVRPELGVGGQHRTSPTASSATATDHFGHQVYKNGPGYWCSDCKVEF